MIPYTIIPSFHIGSLHINMYGIMFSLGMLLATMLAVNEAKRRKIEADNIYDLVIYLIFGTIVGARLFYVSFYWPSDMPFGFFDIFKIWEGGMAFFGGFMGALLAGFIYLKKHKMDFWTYSDIFTVPLIVGHIVGRVGDFLTGGHPGQITNLPWGVYMDGALRHPVVLYEILGLTIILLIILSLKRIRLEQGGLFLCYILLYSLQRIFLDRYRLVQTDPRTLSLTPSQIVAIILFIAALYILIVKYKNHKYNNHAGKISTHKNEVN